MYVCIQILIERKSTSRLFESFLIYLCVTYEIKQTFENSSYIYVRIGSLCVWHVAGYKISAFCSNSFGFLSVFKANMLQLLL